MQIEAVAGKIGDDPAKNNIAKEKLFLLAKTIKNWLFLQMKLTLREEKIRKDYRRA